MPNIDELSSFSLFEDRINESRLIELHEVIKIEFPIVLHMGVCPGVPGTPVVPHPYIVPLSSQHIREAVRSKSPELYLSACMNQEMEQSSSPCMISTG